MNEHSFIKAVHRSLPNDIYRWKIHDTFTGGVPDAFYAGPAGTLFVEYKYIKTLPKRHTTELKLGLSPLQINWLNMMCDLGHSVAAIIGTSLGVLVLTDKQWTERITLEYYFANNKPRPYAIDFIKSVVSG